MTLPYATPTDMLIVVVVVLVVVIVVIAVLYCVCMNELFFSSFLRFVNINSSSSILHTVHPLIITTTFLSDEYCSPG